MPILSREEMTTGYYIRLNAEDQTGVLADVTTILSRAGISIDAIMQQSRLKTSFNCDFDRSIVESKWMTLLRKFKHYLQFVAKS